MASAGIEPVAQPLYNLRLRAMVLQTTVETGSLQESFSGAKAQMALQDDLFLSN